MKWKLIFLVSTIYIIFFGATSAFSVVWFFDYYEKSHFIVAVLLSGIGATLLFFSRYKMEFDKKLWIVVILVPSGLICTIHLIMGGIKDVFGYAVIIALLLFTAYPFVKYEKRT